MERVQLKVVLILQEPEECFQRNHFPSDARFFQTVLKQFLEIASYRVLIGLSLFGKSFQVYDKLVDVNCVCFQCSRAEFSFILAMGQVKSKYFLKVFHLHLSLIH